MDTLKLFSGNVRKRKRAEGKDGLTLCPSLLLTEDRQWDLVLGTEFKKGEARGGSKGLLHNWWISQTCDA